MSVEQPLIQDVYMSLEMVAALDQADATALKTEIARHEGQINATALWLETVSVQYEARDAYVRQKGMWAHLGSMASGSRYYSVPITGRAEILQREVDDAELRLGPLQSELHSEGERRTVCATRIAGLLKQEDARLLRSFTMKRRRPAASVPDTERMILAARIIGKQHNLRMRGVLQAPASSQHRELYGATVEAIVDLDAQLLGMLSKH